MSTVDYGVQAKQLTASGLVTDKRSLFRQAIIFHPISSDSEYKFYDLDAAPSGGEPYYSLAVYGKQTDVIPMPDPGVLFNNGIYVTVVSGTTVTVLYEEV
jgi:hypothetical protein